MSEGQPFSDMWLKIPFRVVQKSPSCGSKFPLTRSHNPRRLPCFLLGTVKAVGLMRVGAVFATLIPDFCKGQ